MQESNWSYLAPLSATTTGTGQLSLQPSDGDQPAEVRASGTLSNRSKFDLQYQVPADLQRPITALRFEALPNDIEAAKRIPDAGFVLSRIRLYWSAPGETPREIQLRHMFGDEPRSYYSAERTLDDDTAGWASFPRLSELRSAVCVLSEPLPVEQPGQLQVVLEHNDDGAGSQATVIRRLRVAATDAPAWMQWVASDEFGSRRSQVNQLREQRNGLRVAEVPVMAEQPDPQRRVTYVFTRGNWLTPGAAVEPSVPRALGEATTPVDRLALARYLFSSKNPLTARVRANRGWEQLFGQGLVTTPEDFGSQGQPPTHPELLDWLAASLQTDWDWSQARLFRELASSATYGQSAAASTAARDADPLNRWYARGPRQRLSAEMVRDQALAVSGLLDRQVGGPSVMPPQPDGVWRTVYNNSQWQTSPGGSGHRRALYTYWRRTSPYPASLIFDATSREVCTLRRFPTNTPLQALAVMNDTAILDAARALGEQMWRQPTVAEAVRWGYQRVTGRMIAPQDEDALTRLFAFAIQNFEADRQHAMQIAPDAARYAATVAAQALLNMDAAMTR
jgi:hypothetical protein